MTKIKVGDKAPDFILKDHRGQEFKLSDHKGLFFYPSTLWPGPLSVPSR